MPGNIRLSPSNVPVRYSASDEYERRARILIDVVSNSVPSKHSRRAYATALRNFFEWHRSQGSPVLDRDSVQQYRNGLDDSGVAAATINLRLAAIRRLATEAYERGWIPFTVASGIQNVRMVRSAGRRFGKWLSKEEAAALIASTDDGTLQGLRDMVALGLLLGCGLRRFEARLLTVEQLQIREGRWALIDIKGKGRRLRTIAVPDPLKPIIDAWLTASRIATGPILRKVSASGKIGDHALTDTAIWKIVRKRANACGLKSDIAPHDLRRTSAMLSYKGGADIQQIQFFLGHASISTTEMYLGTRQQLTNAPNDTLASLIPVPNKTKPSKPILDPCCGTTMAFMTSESFRTVQSMTKLVQLPQISRNISIQPLLREVDLERYDVVLTGTPWVGRIGWAAKSSSANA